MIKSYHGQTNYYNYANKDRGKQNTWTTNGIERSYTLNDQDTKWLGLETTISEIDPEIETASSAQQFTIFEMATHIGD